MTNIFSWFERNKDWGIFLLRLFIGLRLIYGVQDNVLSWEHMTRFSDFLQQFHFPIPLVCAVISVYAQLIAGIMVILGWGIRYAAIILIINFLVALVMVHRSQPIEAMTAPMAILFSAILFLFHGAGRISIDRSTQLKRSTKELSY
jgi:putative oxidoreductase